MPYIISKQVIPSRSPSEKDTELLPPLDATCIFQNGYDDLTGKYRSSQLRHIALLYQAVANRENYYADHTPTAFGDPEYTRLCGIVDGICLVAGIQETISTEKITLSKGGKVLLTVDLLAQSRHEMR